MAGTSVTELVALLQDATSKDVLPALEELQRRFRGHRPEHPAARYGRLFFETRYSLHVIPPVARFSLDAASRNQPLAPLARSEAVTAGAPVLLVALLQAGSGGDARPAAAAAEAISLLAREADSSVDDALVAAGVAPALVGFWGNRAHALRPRREPSASCFKPTPSAPLGPRCARPASPRPW